MCVVVEQDLHERCACHKIRTVSWNIAIPVQGHDDDDDDDDVDDDDDDELSTSFWAKRWTNREMAHQSSSSSI